MIPKPPSPALAKAMAALREREDITAINCVSLRHARRHARRLGRRLQQFPDPSGPWGSRDYPCDERRPSLHDERERSVYRHKRGNVRQGQHRLQDGAFRDSVSKKSGERWAASAPASGIFPWPSSFRWPKTAVATVGRRWSRQSLYDGHLVCAQLAMNGE
jgi:hypothetical protein